MDGDHQYNGNISGIRWQIAEPGTSSVTGEHAYGFKYDELNRLTKATYGQDPSLLYETNKNRYSMPDIQYDLNGNITKLQRNGKVTSTTFGLADDLTYSYSLHGVSTGNKLMDVSDAVTSNYSVASNDFREQYSSNNLDYSYDANGNVIRDDNKGITSIVYNHLNLPQQINFANGGKIVYLYDALGVKHKKVVYTNSTTILYTQLNSGHSVYIDNALKYILMPEGRLTPIPNTSNYQYEYFLKDHLGDVMVTFADVNNDGTPEILSKDEYYPFGLTLPDLSTSTGTANFLKYNGKELQEDWNLNLYDYGARLYDGVIGRWGVSDPLSEQYRRWSSYNYCMNNPLRFIDPDGMKVAESENDNDKDIFGRRRHDDKGIYVRSELRVNEGSEAAFNSANLKSSKNGESKSVDSKTYHLDGDVAKSFPGITEDKGGFIDNFIDFYLFMLEKAKTSKKEVASYCIKEPIKGNIYFIQRWNENDEKNSWNYREIPGYDFTNVIYELHVHLDYGVMSYADASTSYNLNIPVYALLPNERLYRLYYPSSGKGPIRRIPGYNYGEIASKKELE